MATIDTESLCARDLMTQPVMTVRTGTSIRQVAELLTEQRISGAVVVDRSGRPVGVISLTDIATLVTGIPLPDGRARPNCSDGRSVIDVTQVEDLMTPEILQAAPDQPLCQIAAKLCSMGVHRLLVIEGDQLVGIVTALDIVAALCSQHESTSPREEP